MVSYKPIRLDSEDVPNILPIKMIAVMGIGRTALEKKEMAFCGGKNAWGDYCRMPVYYSKDKSLRDVACGMCGSEINWEGFFTYTNFCPECKEKRDSILQYCTRHSPPVQLQKQVNSQ